MGTFVWDHRRNTFRQIIFWPEEFDQERVKSGCVWQTMFVCKSCRRRFRYRETAAVHKCHRIPYGMIVKAMSKQGGKTMDEKKDGMLKEVTAMIVEKAEFFVEEIDRIPERLRDDMLQWIWTGKLPLSAFLQSVLANDLTLAVMYQAKGEHPSVITDTVWFLYQCVPQGCWGSHEKMANWIELGGLVGHRKKMNELSMSMNPLKGECPVVAGKEIGK